MFCKYHPIIESTFSCQNCKITMCDDCVNEDNYTKSNQCYLCKNELTELERKNNILPFWRRLQESFRYPLNSNSAMLIIGIAILSTVSGYIPSLFALVWSLILTGALFKYSFSCLNNTSLGDLEAPDISESFGGGLSIALNLFLIIILLFFIFWVSLYFLGPMFASLIGLFLISSFPAIMINYALSESVFEALNPQNVFRLITSIGLPYGLLLGFILIMITSVGVINEVIGQDFSFFSLILQACVSNYYTIVVFHIMGYMIYQYHKELGFESIKLSANNYKTKSVFEKNLANIDILIKEGKSNEAIYLFNETISSYSQEKNIKHQYFELLLITKSKTELESYASSYLSFLSQENRYEQIPTSLKRVYQIVPNFKPNSADQRHKIASLCADKGDSKLVIKMINGIHKEFPNYHDLVGCYSLMAMALDQLPNMQSHAKACRNLINRLAKQKSLTAN